MKLIEQVEYYDKLIGDAKASMKKKTDSDQKNKEYELTLIQKICCYLYLDPFFGLAVFLLANKLNLFFKILILLCTGLVIPLSVFAYSYNRNYK